jgi:hypothetical protein
MFGAVKTVITCEPAAETAAPCPAGTAPAITTAYLLDVTAQHQVDAAFSPVDHASASSLGLHVFSLLIGLWLVTVVLRVPIRALNRR